MRVYSYVVTCVCIFCCVAIYVCHICMSVCIHMCLPVCIYTRYTTPGVMLKWHLPEAEGTAAVMGCLPTSESYKTLHAPLQQTKGRADDPTVFLLIFRDRI